MGAASVNVAPKSHGKVQVHRHYKHCLEPTGMQEDKGRAQELTSRKVRWGLVATEQGVRPWRPGWPVSL